MKRLEDLERISNSFKGVEKSFAVQAGREIRIIVEPRSINDDQVAHAWRRRWRARSRAR